MSYKVTITDTHFYFLTGPLSNWHPSTFVVPEYEQGVLVDRIYNCNEQYMMARKAEFFGDEETKRLIMEVVVREGQTFTNDIPDRQKKLGRAVRNFDPEKWTKEVACGFVLDGNMAKFSQNPDMKKYLMDTGDSILVEGASYDKIWGVGLAWNDKRILDEANWRGTNWLGHTHMLTRTRFREMETQTP